LSALRVVLGDQLSQEVAALRGYAEGDVVLLAEVMAECSYVPHHPRKIVLVLSAMRHFAEALHSRGMSVRYVRLDDPENTQSLAGEVARAVAALQPDLVIATSPGEWRVREDMRRWEETAGVAVEIREDDRFGATHEMFANWAKGKTAARMEFFYRAMRRQHDLLMDGDVPVGGKWNFDSENRKRLPKGVAAPAAKRFAPDAMTQEVMTLVAARFATHYGTLEGFDYPVTAEQARAGFADFLAHRLASFGDWQDAMAADAPYLFHALISAPLNLGLLRPLDLCRAAEAAYRAGAAPLNAVEGFIRQILGWREFMRGIYWLHMPGFAKLNALGATRALPEFYWSGETKMRCVAAVVGQTMALAYAHHIQRLMITGNFALLAGLDPDAVDEWYLAVYADAYEWVEMPNTRGMALYADGGTVGSKPYAASGAYINRMSDYCGACFYDVKESSSPRACPFNALYWDFIARHETRFAANPRMQMPVQGWRRMEEGRQVALRRRAAALLEDLDQGVEL
jgi:deoxyribodipyrimidine photolyase-related protein